MYPRIVVNTEKYRHNVRNLKEILAKIDVQLIPVTKVYTGWPELVQIAYEEGITTVADSRMENLERITAPVKKLMLRLPMLSEIERVVQGADQALVSELATIMAIDEAAQKLDKDFEMVLMIDLGDLREGVLERQFDDFIQNLPTLKRAKFAGVGTNLTCFGGILPSQENLSVLINAHQKFQEHLGYELPVISGGNSSSLPLVAQGKLPQEITNLRVGEGIVLGSFSDYTGDLDGFVEGVFTLEAELIEVREKPSLPWGEVGLDAFGEVPTHTDRGMMLRGICAVGRQDVLGQHLRPQQPVEIIGGSSDHMLIDLKYGNYKVGDVLSFDLNYVAILELMTSQFVEKVTR